MEPFPGPVRVRDMDQEREGRAIELEPRLRDALRELPVPPPRPGFAARVFAAVPRERRGAAPLAWALAASLAAAVGLGVWLEQRAPPAPAATPGPEGKVVMLEPGRTGPVRLSFRSPRELAGVTIHLQLPRGVELEGYPGRQSLQWQADFQAGANQLELPLVMRDGEGGILTATLDHGGSHREFTVKVRAERPATLFPDAPATRSAVDGRYST
jgi:hypothetical protein